MTKLALPPLSLYIHIPWCEKKCPYCDFNSHVSKTIPETEYLQVLIEDLKSQLHFVQGREIHSIFIGGGTPSLFSAISYQWLLASIQTLVPFSANIEITLEANPSSSEQEKFAGFLRAGINRLSIGVQSFHDQQLQALGRIHQSSQAIAAALAAKAAGFTRLNLDIMHGLPGQSHSDAMADLHQAIALEPSHISWYQLTIEQNTEFFRFPPQLPEENTLADIQDDGLSLLESAGYKQYEISAYSRPNEESRHNINYWHYGDYLAIGAGAHGKITDVKNQQVIRFNNSRSPKDYMQRIGNYCAQKMPLEHDELIFEALMNSLRLNQGIAITPLLERSGIAAEALEQLLTPLINDGLVKIDSHVYATELGRRYLNSVLERLVN